MGIDQTVKRYSGSYLQHSQAAKRGDQDFAHAQLIDGQWIKSKFRRSQAVNAIFGLSKVLTAVTVLDTATMGVIPLAASAIYTKEMT